MAIIHKATLVPTKLELVADWLDRQSSGGGQVELVGSYRFDDPAGAVGVEAMLVRRGGVMLHVPLTYRGAPLPGGEARLVGTIRHSVLGERWVYDASGDPVARGCFVRALRGEQDQAEMEVWDGEELVERRESVVRVRSEPGRPGDAPADELRIARELGADLDGARRLVAVWPEGQGVVAALV